MEPEVLRNAFKSICSCCKASEGQEFGAHSVSLNARLKRQLQLQACLRHFLRIQIDCRQHLRKPFWGGVRNTYFLWSHLKPRVRRRQPCCCQLGLQRMQYLPSDPSSKASSSLRHPAHNNIPVRLATARLESTAQQVRNFCTSIVSESHSFI